MRVTMATAAMVGIALQTSALGAPADDLVFCSKRPVQAERLACYEAAARIADVRRIPAATQSSDKPIVPARTAPATDAYAAASPVGQQPNVVDNPFSGAYVALGGAYGILSPRSYAMSDSFFLLSADGEVRPTGPSVVGTVGYNWLVERWLIGLEVSGRWGRERATDQRTRTTTTTASSLFTYRYDADYAAHVSARTGMTFKKTLIFAKIGIGGAHVKEHFLVEGPIPSTSITKSHFAPSFLFGFGAEQNLGRVFARVDAEMEWINFFDSRASDGNISATSQATVQPWAARVQALVGMRL